MVILATSGREWADRTKGLTLQVPHLDIFSQGWSNASAANGKFRRGACSARVHEARAAALVPIWAPLLEEAKVAIIAQTHVLQLRQPAHRDSGGVNAASIVARRGSERGRTLLDQRKKPPVGLGGLVGSDY